MANYQVTPDGRIVYVTTQFGCKEYTVWGIGPKGFLHGAGQYLRREDITGVLIDLPTSQEIERYYSLLDKFWNNDD